MSRRHSTFMLTCRAGCDGHVPRRRVEEITALHA